MFFFGNIIATLIGAVIGGIVSYKIAKLTVRREKEKERKQELRDFQYSIDEISNALNQILEKSRNSSEKTKTFRELWEKQNLNTKSNKLALEAKWLGIDIEDSEVENATVSLQDLSFLIVADQSFTFKRIGCSIQNLKKARREVLNILENERTKK